MHRDSSWREHFKKSSAIWIKRIVDFEENEEYEEIKNIKRTIENYLIIVRPTTEIIK